MVINWLFLFLLAINTGSAAIFVYDKIAAIKKYRRISEASLHLMEALGGVFSIFLLMYLLPHKNKKISYWIWTWMVMAGWLTYFISKK